MNAEDKKRLANVGFVEAVARIRKSCRIPDCRVCAGLAVDAAAVEAASRSGAGYPMTPQPDRRGLREWVKTQPWFVRLDEWQHGHLPQRILALQVPWTWFWKPLCDYTERWFVRTIDSAAGMSLEAFRAKYLPDLPMVTTNATTSAGAYTTEMHTETTYAAWSHGTQVSCTVPNCPVCRPGSSVDRPK